MVRRARIAAAGLLATALGACAAPPPEAVAAPAACAAGGSRMARVELIFGQALADGGSGVSEAQWLDFLAQEVTPRFPDGLTAFDAYGQWRHPDKGIVRLTSKVLLVWYRPSTEAEAAIEAIRAAYKRRFDQISVMRVDGLDCVSF